MSLTAHTIICNDDVYVGYAIRSIIDHVERVFVFDTGSTDNTGTIIDALVADYPGKIVFERKGPSDKAKHTRLRQEMLDRTTTDWFMILDGDEVWTKRAIAEAVDTIARTPREDLLIAPYYACVGDVFHDYLRRGSFRILNRNDRLAPRFVRRVPGLHWRGEYGADMLVGADGNMALTQHNSLVLDHRFWHLTHLQRSSGDEGAYTSGGNRDDKRRPTYLGIGRRIKEPVPEVFDKAFLERNRLSFPAAAINLLAFGTRLLRRSR